VLSTTQVFINWDKHSEVNAWLQENPKYIPKSWASHEDMVPADAHVGGRTLGCGAGRGAWWGSTSQTPTTAHLQFDINVNARQIGIEVFPCYSNNAGSAGLMDRVGYPARRWGGSFVTRLPGKFNDSVPSTRVSYSSVPQLCLLGNGRGIKG
jgi:hypothetical protein